MPTPRSEGRGTGEPARAPSGGGGVARTPPRVELVVTAGSHLADVQRELLDGLRDLTDVVDLLAREVRTSGEHPDVAYLLDQLRDLRWRLWQVDAPEPSEDDAPYDYWARQPRERLEHALRTVFVERMQIEDLLAEGLGYRRGNGGPDDPTGGGWITGEHTPVTLAHEARRALLRRRPEA